MKTWPGIPVSVPHQCPCPYVCICLEPSSSCTFCTHHTSAVSFIRFYKPRMASFKVQCDEVRILDKCERARVWNGRPLKASTPKHLGCIRIQFRKLLPQSQLHLIVLVCPCLFKQSKYACSTSTQYQFENGYIMRIS